MQCPECGQTLPEIAARCPNCQAPVAGGFGGTMPPRASQRDFRTDASVRLSESAMRADRYLRRLGAPWSRFSETLERYLASPELWLSVLIPGTGYLYLGRWLIGALAIATTLIFLAGFSSLLTEGVVDGVNRHMLVFGIFLGLMHMHVWTLGDRLRPGSAGTMHRNAATFLVLVVVTLQFSLISHVATRYFYGFPNQVTIYGQPFWAPILLPGDRLVLRELPVRELRNGDLVQCSTTICERILGTPGDVLLLDHGRISRNGELLLATHTKPLLAWGSHYVPDWAMRETILNKQDVVVPEGKIAYLWWGREIRTAYATETRGLIVGIAAPDNRRCRFVNGVPHPYERRGLLRYLWGW
ncbi:MAG TPA: zinc ribbon domain-containing protein [Candidatus Ozemobacteraceae bacterium]